MNIDTTKLSGQQLKIVEYLAAKYPRDVPIDNMINHLYSDDPDGGPENARLVISVQLNKIRKRIAHTGWTVPKCGGGKGNTARYRLVKIDS